MRKAAELVALGKRSLCPDRLKAPGGRLSQPGQRTLREDIPQQSDTLFPQLPRGIIGCHIVSVAETACLRQLNAPVTPSTARDNLPLAALGLPVEMRETALMMLFLMQARWQKRS